MSLDKFRKSLEKKSYTVGFNEVQGWISLGNARLNDVVSGDMLKGIPLNRSTVITGLKGTGKSFLMANAAREAQAMGYHIVYLDTEYALGDGFMEKIGVNMEPDFFTPLNIGTIEQAMEVSSEVFRAFAPEEPVILMMDSLSNLVPSNDMGKNEDGKMAYGQGLQQKLYKQLVTNINNKVGDRNMAFVFTSHMYVNGSDHYGNPILKPNIGEGAQFLPSVGLQLSKAPLRDGKEPRGILIKASTFKTRYTMEGKRAEIDLPWDTGMDFYDGAIDVIEKAGVATKNGAWFSYEHPTEGTVKFQRNDFKKHADFLMQEYSNKYSSTSDKDREEYEEASHEESADE